MTYLIRLLVCILFVFTTVTKESHAQDRNAIDMNTYSATYQQMLTNTFTQGTQSIIAKPFEMFAAVVPVKAVSIKAPSNYVTIGSKFVLQAIISPTKATNKRVVWTTNKPKIAKVTKTGQVTGVSPGTVKITARTVNGKKIATKTLQVVHGVSKVTLNKNEAMIINNGGEVQLEATIAPAKATVKTVKWVSSNPSIATVDKTGKVIAMSYGTVNITAVSIQDPTKKAICTVTVGVPNPITSVIIEEAPEIVEIGKPLTLKAIIEPANATIKDVKWITSDPTIATVDANGKVTGIEEGTAIIDVITVEGEFVDSKTLEFVYPVESITLEQQTLQLDEGQGDMLTVVVSPENAVATFNFTSSNPKVATVDETGYVTAVSAGTTTITVTSVQDPTKKATCQVTVKIRINSINIEGSSSVNVGGKLALKAVVEPENVKNKAVTWSSSDKKIATVSDTGQVEGIAVGKVTITAKANDGGVTATKTINVVNAVKSVTLDPKTVTIGLGDPEVRLNATVSPSNATNSSLKWETSDKKIATVDSSGRVRAVAVGKATITVTSEDDSTKKATATVTVQTPVTVTGVKITSKEDKVNVGASFTFQTTITPANATNKYITWTSSDERVAIVNSVGQVFGIDAGTVTITATTNSGGFVASKTLTVVQAVDSITLNRSQLTLKVGEPDTSLVASVNPSKVTNRSVTWISSNPKVATVDASGNVKALSAGTTTITATSVQDPTKKVTCIVTVPTAVTGVTITNTVDFVKIGSPLTLQTTIAPVNATIKDVVWISSNPNVATVNAYGQVTGVAPGTTTVMVTTVDGNFTATKTLTVVYGIDSVTLDKTQATLTIGEPDLLLTAIVNPYTATNKAVTWTTSNPAVATVDANGRVRALAPGTTTITVTSVQDPTKKVTCVVTVPTPVTGVSITSPSDFVKIGSPLTLQAAIAPVTATNKAVTWFSSNPAVATVNAYGQVTGVAPGTTTIMVTTAEGYYTATKTFTVLYGVDNIMLDKSQVTMKIGDADIQLTATVTPYTATNKSVTWTSSNPSVATVDMNGIVRAVAPGITTITVTSLQDPTKKATCVVTVPTSVTGVTMTTTSNVIKIGSPLTLQADVSPQDATNKTVTWTTSNPAIATVTQSGIVSGISPGVVTISAVTNDGYFTASTTLSVIYPVDSVTLNQVATAIKIGTEQQLIATVSPYNATDKTLVWQSNNEAVATVDATGKVRAIATGTATIIVTSTQDPSKKAVCTVLVVNE